MNPKQALQKAESTLQEYNSSVPKSLFRLAPKPHGKGMKKVKSAKAKDGGYFEVYERPAKAGQDRYKMYHAFGNGRGLDLGTHPSADGALKFARNNGIIEGRYDSYGYDFKDRWDGETPRATGRDYFGRPMRAEPEPYIFKDKAEAEKLYKQMARRGKIPAGHRKPIKNQRGNEVEWVVMVQEDIEQIDEATKAEAKQLTTKLNSLKRSGFRVSIGDQPKFFWATASKTNADKSHKAAVDAIIKAFKAKLDYSMPGDERGDFVKRYITASGIEIEFEKSTEIDDGSKTLQVNVSTEPYSEDTVSEWRRNAYEKQAQQDRVEGNLARADLKKKHPHGRITHQMIGRLKREMAKVDAIDPSSPAYKKMIAMLDHQATHNPEALKLLADANVKFVSKLAKNRLPKGKNLNKKTLVPEALKKAETVLEKSKYTPTENDKDGDGWADWMTDADKALARKAVSNLAKAVAKGEREKKKEIDSLATSILKKLGLR